MGVLTVERVGGLGGFGLPGSHVRSRGQVALEQLSAEDRKAVEDLFAQRRGAKGSDKASPVRDAFIYRLSRPAGKGKGKGTECIEVREEQLPVALIQCVKDELV